MIHKCDYTFFRASVRGRATRNIFFTRFTPCPPTTSTKGWGNTTKHRHRSRWKPYTTRVGPRQKCKKKDYHHAFHKKLKKLLRLQGLGVAVLLHERQHPRLEVPLLRGSPLVSTSFSLGKGSTGNSWTTPSHATRVPPDPCVKTTTRAQVPDALGIATKSHEQKTEGTAQNVTRKSPSPHTRYISGHRSIFHVVSWP